MPVICLIVCIDLISIYDMKKFTVRFLLGNIGISTGGMSYVHIFKRFNIHHYRLRQNYSVNHRINWVYYPSFTEVHMLVRIHEVLPHSKIIYFDIYIKMLYIFL